MPAAEQPKTLHTAAVLKRYWHHTLRYPWLFALGVLGVVVAQAAYVAAPLYLAEAINRITYLPVGPESLSQLYVPIGLFGLLSLIAWVGGRLEMWGGMIVIIRVGGNLVDEAFQHLMHHSHQFFVSSFTGSLTRKVGRYMSSYEKLYYSLQTSVLPSVLYIAGITIVLFFKSVWLGTILFLAVVGFTLLQWKMTSFQRPLRVRKAAADSVVTGSIADSISNHSAIQLFARNAYEESVVRSGMQKLQEAWLRLWYSDLLVYGAYGLFSVTVNVLLLSVAAFYWSRGVLSVGDFLVIQAYAFGLFNSVWSIGREFKNIYGSLADASEMVEILETPHHVQDAPGATHLHVSSGVISFNNVTFGFEDARPILEKYSLTINGGEKVALVGPSGAGKTTITKLLLRLYDIQKGEICVDDQSIDGVTQDSLRSAIAFVPQEPVLFHRTLKENIRYGRQDATDEEVVEAAKKAHCHEFISRLPLGYDTLVGERGVKLSGGERQRVSIARAILKNAPILVLDEATSSLDSESESYIQDALEVLMKGKTSVVIAHRLSTIMKMDRIVVMQEGRIVSEGTHKELLAAGGLYKKLWSIQVGGFFGDVETQHSEEKEEQKSDLEAMLAVEEEGK